MFNSFDLSCCDWRSLHLRHGFLKHPSVNSFGIHSPGDLLIEIISPKWGKYAVYRAIMTPAGTTSACCLRLGLPSDTAVQANL